MTLRTTRCLGSLTVSLLAALLFFVPSPAAIALDLTDGRIKLTLHEGIGRFSISCQIKNKEGIYVPLLSSQDPRTTMLSVVVGNKIYRMGESSEFAETAEKTATGGRFVWKSSFLQVTEAFTFLASSGSSVSNGVRIDIILKNLSTQDIAVGVRYLLDTYLGESSFVHFRTDTLSEVTHELTIAGSDHPAWWMSPLVGDPENFGLQIMSSGPGITVPDRIVFANWKRLSDTPWSYETSIARNFSLLPYSVNDSAASQYYDPRSIPRGTEYTITLALGRYTKEGFSAATPSSPPGSATTVQQTGSAAPEASNNSQTVRTDLATVDRILAQIDAAVSAGGTISDSDLNLIESALKDLEGRVNRFAPAAGK